MILQLGMTLKLTSPSCPSWIVNLGKAQPVEGCVSVLFLRYLINLALKKKKKSTFCFEASGVSRTIEVFLQVPMAWRLHLCLKRLNRRDTYLELQSTALAKQTTPQRQTTAGLLGPGSPTGQCWSQTSLFTQSSWPQGIHQLVHHLELWSRH